MTQIGELLNHSTVPTHLTSADAAQRIEFLRTRLTERDVTVEEVWDYIALNHQPPVGQQMQPLARFVTEADLPNFWWLHDWWAPVVDKPTTLPTPTIIQFCWYVNHTPGSPAVSFNDALAQWYNRAVAHCKMHDMDPTNPGETAEERKRRRNRERMAKVRGHRAVPEKDLKHDEALLAQVRGLEGQCELLKKEAAEIDAELKMRVLGHQQRMLEASEERKTKAAEFKLRIDTLRQEIRSLTTKR